MIFLSFPKILYYRPTNFLLYSHFKKKKNIKKILKEFLAPHYRLSHFLIA